MNCKQVQELLPLYVACDLEEKRARLVMAHVQSCAECAGFADEYRETRQLLQQFAPPPFSEAVYAGIRQRVLREIGREATAPGLSRLLGSLFRPRLRWAVATALLLAVFVFGFYFIANRRPNLINERQQVVDNVRPEDRPASPAIKTSEGLTPTSTVKNRGSLQRLAGGTHQSQRRKRTGGVPDRTSPATVDSADSRSLRAEAAPNGNNPAEAGAVPTRDSATSEKTLRVEMQTRDPNIRIIWFTPQPTKQDSPGKFSKGT
jgi:hypothetical protein